MAQKYLLREKNIELLYSYGQKTSVDVNIEEMSEENGKRVMSKIIKDFQAGLISCDDVSALCELLYAKFEYPDSDLHDLLLLGAEIEWNLRWDPITAGNYLNLLKKEFGSNWKNT